MLDPVYASRAASEALLFEKKPEGAAVFEDCSVASIKFHEKFDRRELQQTREYTMRKLKEIAPEGMSSYLRGILVMSAC